MSGQQVWILNGALCVLLVGGGFKVKNDWKAFDEEHQASQVKDAVAKPAAKAPAPVATAAVAVPEVWTEIGTRNPFSFDRNDANVVPAVEQAPPPAPKPVLFGVVNVGSGPQAMLGEAGSRRSSQAVKVGETFKGWTIVKIESKSVTVKNGTDEESIKLGNVPIDRDGGKTAAVTGVPVAPTVTTTSTAPAPSAATRPSTPPTYGPGAVVVATPGTRVVHSPFGDFLEQLPPDQKQ